MFEVPICTLPDGGGFEIESMHLKGVVLHKNECEVRVRYMRDLGIHHAGWSCMTMVHPCDFKFAATPTDEEGKPQAVTLTCVCGKVCTSKSGLTLHAKNCVQAQIKVQK